ncbi:MAG: geranylgeranylglyceryl/heptaprenylglyceryl phosphate synthase [Thermoproteota archaeon]
MKLKFLKLGKVEHYLLEEIEKGPIHMLLLDPDEVSISSGEKLVRLAESKGSAAVMVGGSTIGSQIDLDNFVKSLKAATSLPIIIFPNNVQAVVPSADAIWYMVLMNSLDWYFVMGAQIQASLLIKKYDLEAIPMGYLVFNSETAVASMGRALPLPKNQPEVAVAYSLAAQYIGMRFIYLEGGSGAPSPIPAEIIHAVANTVDIPVIVGGGIRDITQVNEIIKAGASVIVTGTLAEQNPNMLESLITYIRGFRRTN